MSLLEQQLAELQAKKLKVEQFEKVLNSLGTSTTHEEVLSEVSQFINNQIDDIENGTVRIPDSNTSLTTEEIVTLKQIASRVIENQYAVRPNLSAYATTGDESAPVRKSEHKKPAQQKRAANPDKLSFAMANRHLSEKRCSVISDNGNEFQGKIVGTDAPYLVVQLDTGNTINVPPEEVRVG